MVCINKGDELNKILISLTQLQDVVKERIRSCDANRCMDPQSSGTKQAVTKNVNECKTSKDLWLTLSDSEDSTYQILKELRLPDKFICPLTQQVMTDPVILSSGKTVERKFIEALFNADSTCTVCPVTKTVPLSSKELIPDADLQAEIERWQENKSINDERRDNFRMLLRKLAYPDEDQLATAAELRALVHDSPSYAIFFYDMGTSSVLELARPLLSQESDTAESLREDLIVTFRLLAKHNKKIRKFLMNHRDVVRIISDSLRSGSLETRRSALSLVRYITADPGSRHVLTQLGVIMHLVEIVEEGDLLLLYDAVLALFRLKFGSLRVIDGILTAILHNLEDENQIGNIERLLNMVMKDTVVWKHVAEADIMHQKLFNLLMDCHSDAVKAFCVATLLKIIRKSRTALLSVIVYEEKYKVIAQILEEGTAEAKEDGIKLIRLLDAEKLNQTSAMEVHQDQLVSADDVTAAVEVLPNNLESVDVIDPYTPDRMEGVEIQHKELTYNSADDRIGDAADIHRNDLKSVDVMVTHESDYMEETQLHHNEILDLLEESEGGEVMEMWVEILLGKIGRNEAALMATWKREQDFRTITRVKAVGSVDAWWTADEIFKCLETVNPDQIQPDS